ncbi:hypothetical protein AB0G97_23045 [Streptomyces sp. NPDC020755]
MKYGLPPHEQERVAFTVGPKSVFDGQLPRAYTFAITLHLDDKTRVKVPEMTYMDPSSIKSVLWSAERAVEDGERFGFTTVSCIKEQERKARKIIKQAKNVSPELQRYSAELTRLAGLASKTT